MKQVESGFFVPEFFQEGDVLIFFEQERETANRSAEIGVLGWEKIVSPYSLILFCGENQVLLRLERQESALEDDCSGGMAKDVFYVAFLLNANDPTTYDVALTSVVGTIA